jgi:hypothetical protein
MATNRLFICLGNTYIFGRLRSEKSTRRQTLSWVLSLLLQYTGIDNSSFEIIFYTCTCSCHPRVIAHKSSPASSTSYPQPPQLQQIIHNPERQTSQMPRMADTIVGIVQIVPIIRGISQHNTPQRYRNDTVDSHFRPRRQTSRHTRNPHQRTREPQTTSVINTLTTSHQVPLIQVPDRPRDARPQGNRQEPRRRDHRRIAKELPKIIRRKHIRRQMPNLHMRKCTRHQRPVHAVVNHIGVITRPVAHVLDPCLRKS